MVYLREIGRGGTVLRDIISVLTREGSVSGRVTPRHTCTGIVKHDCRAGNSISSEWKCLLALCGDGSRAGTAVLDIRVVAEDRGGFLREGLTKYWVS